MIGRWHLFGPPPDVPGMTVVSGRIRRCFTCKAAVIILDGQLQGTIEFDRDPAGQLWITPHRKNCQRSKAALS